MPLSKFLNSIGLEQNAQKVYLALLGFGDAPCSRIAKKAEIKRTTAYNVLENLIKQGLVSSYKERGVRRFVAESPSKIRNTLEAKIFTLEKYLPKLLICIGNQIFKNFEVIIVDGASTDQTRLVAQDFKPKGLRLQDKQTHKAI